MLVIEIDGLIHQLPEVKENDEYRTNWLVSNGYHVIRFTNEEVLFETEKTLLKLIEKLGSLPSIKTMDEASRVPSPPLGEVFVSTLWG
jgi:5-methyltetrahydrofolate--homocysteine methyltransferase